MSRRPSKEPSESIRSCRNESQINHRPPVTLGGCVSGPGFKPAKRAGWLPIGSGLSGDVLRKVPTAARGYGESDERSGPDALERGH
jgi:hypothetical protein